MKHAWREEEKLKGIGRIENGTVKNCEDDQGEIHMGW